jgi:hypothetical protein
VLELPVVVLVTEVVVVQVHFMALEELVVLVLAVAVVLVGTVEVALVELVVEAVQVLDIMVELATQPHQAVVVAVLHQQGRQEVHLQLLEQMEALVYLHKEASLEYPLLMVVVMARKALQTQAFGFNL